MQRRTFFKSMFLGAAAVMTPKITKVEAAALSEVPAPLPLLGKKSFVTTVKGPTAIVQHGLGNACVYVRAITLDGKERPPKVDPLSLYSVRLIFHEPWHSRRKVYKVVISC
jgi:hypothetical protein